MHATRAPRAANKQNTKTKQTFAVEFARECDNIYRQRRPLEMYTGFHAPKQLHVALHISLQTIMFKLS